MGIRTIMQSQTELKILNGRICANQLRALNSIQSLSEVEFKVFSQFGDDGIIQYLIYHLNLPTHLHTFVEFGVETYEESNTRFLLMNNNWRGLIIDGSEENIKRVENSDYFWKHDLKAKAAFIDAENINSLIQEGGFSGEIGILSVDIDGNDYWVWNAINVVKPVIVVAEYNSTFGAELALSVPYDKAFVRSSAHFSNLYWGCSLQALNKIASERNYRFIGCNSAGNNAYFIDERYLNKAIPTSNIREYFVDAKFKESRDSSGKLTYLSGHARLEAIKNMPLVDVSTGQTDSIENLFKEH